ncbi:MAG: type II and III secretion system protein family protein [Terriglobia bacterium]
MTLLVATLLWASYTTIAQQQPVPASAAPQPSAQQPQTVQPAEPAGSPEALHVIVGRSLVIDSPGRLKRVSIADPSIADAVIVSPSQILVNGRAPGAVSLVLWDESGQNQSFEVVVELDVLDLQQRMREDFPNEPIQVGASKDVVTLAGRVSSQAVADKAIELAKASAPKVVSLLEVPAAPPGAEILLQVKFAEVDRSAVTELGANILGLPGAKNVGAISTQQFGPPTLQGGLTSGTTTTTTTNGVTTTTANGLSVSNLLNIFLFRPDLNLAATIEALQQRNVLEILAEPNLLTESGKEGSFLAGGEFPFPIVQPGGASGVPVVTIQFRPYGVQLTFTPTLAPDGKIHLKVKPEVSTLDFSNALTVAGFLIPALSTRRVESEVELQDGQSFAIAGLVDNRVQETLSKIPGIGDVPILGKLFQSKNALKSRNELLVVVTPRILQPSPPAPLPKIPQFPTPFLPPTQEPRPVPATVPATSH